MSYYFPKSVGEYHYGVSGGRLSLSTASLQLTFSSLPLALPVCPPSQERHPMKPHRLTLTNSLVLGYGLHKRMDVYSPREATKDELEMFHDSDYVDFLSRSASRLPCVASTLS